MPSNSLLKGTPTWTDPEAKYKERWNEAQREKLEDLQKRIAFLEADNERLKAEKEASSMTLRDILGIAKSQIEAAQSEVKRMRRIEHKNGNGKNHQIEMEMPEAAEEPDDNRD